MKKHLVLSALLVGSLALNTQEAQAATYEAHVKEYQVSKSTSGTSYLTHRVDFGTSSSLGRGSLTKRFTFDLSTKKLTEVRLNNSVSKGSPYYTHMYAVTSSGSTVRYSFPYKEFTSQPLTIWKPNLTKPKEVTVYFNDHVSGTGSIQHRVHSFFKY
ncbi:hypothetical protein [Exiguobacterium sp. s26]|uniref:hypothetical protein n=1 Tax=Exiguobacterium sp. s26 TaxID=2751231 RepID=UPI001BE9AA8E|nr:hypothetical protein [Exiguobacterium sp. s26]